MSIYLLIFIMIVSSKIISILFKKISLPPFLGMIALGILIGPTFLDIIKEDNDMETIKFFSKIGLFILIFIAGLETNIENIRRIGKKSAFIAIGGVLVPFIAGYSVTYYFTGTHVTSLVMGLILTATSASITIMMLMNIGKLVTVEGNTVANAAIIDDIIGFMILSVISAIIDTGNFDIKTIVIMIAVNFIYFIAVFIIAVLFIDFLKKKLVNINICTVCLLFSVFFFFIFSMNAWKINMFSITGIYFAGLFLSKTDYRDSVEDTLKISQLLFVPFFFIFIGLALDLKNLQTDFIPYIVLFVSAALIGKIFGSGLVAKISGFDFKRSFRIGCGMTPRGELALILAAIVFYYKEHRFIGEKEFVSVIIMVISTILIIQYLLKALYKERRTPTGVKYDIKAD